MTSRTFRIATVGGVDVRVSPSWLVVAAVIVLGYRGSLVDDGRSAGTALALAVVLALLFTASVLIHELAHALEGKHRGAEVGGITLFLLGGATSLRGHDRRARDEFAVAAIGPWSNIVVAAVLGLIATWTRRWGVDAVADVAALGGWLNLGLAAFNLIPGSPLDGGRVLRSAVWVLTGDRHRATAIAAMLGSLVALGLIGLSVWLLTSAPRGLVPAVGTGLVGAYMLRAARVELLRSRLHRWLARHRAGDIAAATPDEPDAHDSLPRVDADAAADELADLLDDEQPYVVIVDGDTEWVSSLTEIRHAISTLRRAS